MVTNRARPEEVKLKGLQRIRRLTTGYLECARRIEILKRFQDLVRHRERWAHQIGFARPLEELLPEGTTELTQWEVIDQQISRLQPVVGAFLALAGIGTVFTFLEPSFDREKSRVVMDPAGHYDVILQYFELPQGDLGRARQAWFEKVMNVLEQGIGVYEARRARALREKFNPLAWVAGILRFPVIVLGRAGLLDTEEGPSMVLRGYFWLVRVLFLMILTLLAARLGLSTPWQRIAELTH